MVTNYFVIIVIIIFVIIITVIIILPYNLLPAPISQDIKDGILSKALESDDFVTALVLLFVKITEM